MMMMDRTPHLYHEVEDSLEFNAVDIDLLVGLLDTEEASCPPHDAIAEDCGSRKPQTEYYMAPGVARLTQLQQVLPAPGFHGAPPALPELPPHDAPAKETLVPQQPQTDCHMPLGAAPPCVQQGILPAAGFPSAQNGFPLQPPYYASVQENFGPQQTQTEGYMPLAAAQFNVQQQVMPAPVPAPSIYQQPNILQNYLFHQAAPFSHNQVNNGPVMNHHQGLGMNLAPYVNGAMVYTAPAYATVTTDASLIKAPVSGKKRSYTKPHDESKPYIKKPPNAFMIYRKDMRPIVVEELKIRECATVNKDIGRRWKSLSKEEQAKYYKRADQEKQFHSQQFPNWSSGENYGKKRKRIRRKGLGMVLAA